MKILIAEDEPALRRAYQVALERQGYEVTAAANGQEAVDQASAHAFDLLILDIMMPVKTGLEALREIRESGNKTYAIMLTAMAEVDDRVTGLDAGADDYLTKPISLKELMARLRSIERRFETNFTQKELSFANITLNVREQEIIAHSSMRLNANESKLLEYLILNAQDKTVTQEDVYAHTFERNEEKDAGYVWIYISYLKHKLRAIGAQVRITGEEGGPYGLEVATADASAVTQGAASEEGAAA
ncbi:DNA-binding response regulator [Alloscardovia macacae]|uniref:DNA-binding response regulator n=1 Tax=Alloscardovia macacae TaxID=1160091 RepID=A0A1Y2SSD9_9BIFI|nr:response regulator transcription factor [Alloscardovia macacae]OTA25528.1 DNA-binding response regulator [Alloscardovia macacae]OTA28096.1 DNA-binding response regulator [Alloscardovia macacae]